MQKNRSLKTFDKEYYEEIFKYYFLPIYIDMVDILRKDFKAKKIYIWSDPNQLSCPKCNSTNTVLSLDFLKPKNLNQELFHKLIFCS